MFDLSKIFDLSKKFAYLALPDTFFKSKNYCNLHLNCNLFQKCLFLLFFCFSVEVISSRLYKLSHSFSFLVAMMLAFHTRLCINIFALLRQLGTAVLLKTYLYFYLANLIICKSFSVFFLC